jgi:menaquinone-specific isochorismate synthase
LGEEAEVRASSQDQVGRLLARTVPLDPPTAVDLLAVAGDEGFLWEHEGPGRDRPRVGLAGRGVAVRIDLPTGLAGAAPIVADALASIDVDDGVGRPGCGPVALGALPFDHAAPASLAVPELLVGVDPAGAWLTTVGPATRPVATLEAIRPSGRRPAPD